MKNQIKIDGDSVTVLCVFALLILAGIWYTFDIVGSWLNQFAGSASIVLVLSVLLNIALFILLPFAIRKGYSLGVAHGERYIDGVDKGADSSSTMMSTIAKAVTTRRQSVAQPVDEVDNLLPQPPQIMIV